MLTTLSTEDLIPRDHPIRRIRKVVDDVLADLDGEFDVMYARIGRPSVPPEQLLKATVLMALYSVRSERAFCERLNYDLLFKWFLDLPIDSTPPRSIRPRSPRTASVSWARKSTSTAARHCYAGHLLMENRNALIVDIELTQADGYPERQAALTMLARLPRRRRRRTVAADKAYDTGGFIADCRDLGVTPHVAQNTTNRRSAIDGRTTGHAGHRISQRIRPRIEEPFGWIKTIAGGRKLRYTGRQRNRAWFVIAGATYNLLRIAALDTQPA